MPTKSLNTKKIIVVVGPTATNKTNVAIALAKELNGEIVNADAFQVYRELNIGVNKPSTGELKQAPFHLIGNVSIKDKWDIKRFQKEANTIISGIYERKHIPIVVGGSHLYVDALILSYDLDSAPERDNSFDNLSIDELIAELKKYDTELVDKIGKNHKRLVRALQIANFTSVKRNHKKPIYNPLYVLCIKPREQLYEDINKRVDQMIKNG
jgi:tRNA dimethylallyltransferase